MTPHKKIAYVQAAWHTDITDRCKQAFTAELAKHGYDESGVDFFSAPGSLEIPLMAKKLAKTGKYSAVCVSGFVIDGESSLGLVRMYFGDLCRELKAAAPQPVTRGPALGLDFERDLNKNLAALFGRA